MAEQEKYEYVANSHGVQRHDGFSTFATDGDEVAVAEDLTWLDAGDRPMATEARSFRIASVPGGFRYLISTRIAPTGTTLFMGASRAARYSGLELRMGPPFADAYHYCSEGRQGHENIMRQRARWVGARGAERGFVAMMDHPQNLRHPVTWFTRKNLLGAGLLMEEDLELSYGQTLDLHYAFFVLDEDPGLHNIEAFYTNFAS